jgi:hypothetical protein
MKNVYLAIVFTCFMYLAQGQKNWDGGGNDNNWSTAANWFPDGVPTPGEAVVLDNSLFDGSYTVLLPSGTVSVSVETLRILPAAGNTIVLQLPAGNTSVPGLEVTGSGESLELGSGATLRNSSGAVSGEVIRLTGLMRINNGARYLHNTQRGNASLIDKISTAAGTELGIFEFDVPGTAGYTVSLTGNTFGSLVFSASAAGGVKSYSGSGTSTLQINGNWTIRPGATLTSTLSANILLRGELDISGNLNLHPSTAGGTGRSIFFTGTNNIIKGNGNLSLNTNFRNMEVFSGSICTLERSLNLPQTGHTFLLNSGALLHTGNNLISGNGIFTADTDATLGIGSPEGISLSGNTGNIQTATRNFNTGANYIFESAGEQVSGNGLPVTINDLGVDKATGNLQLTNTVRVNGQLQLRSGLINTQSDALIIFAGNTVKSPLNGYGVTNAGWENSFINGPMEWETTLAGPQSIPLGKGTVFAPVLLEKINAGYARYKAEYFPVPYDFLLPVARPPLDHISSIEYWSVETDPSSINTDARIGLSWRSESGVGNSDAARNDLRIAQYADRGMGLRWEETGDDPEISTSGTNGRIVSNLVLNSFSIFTLASRSNLNILPIRGINLITRQVDKTVILDWIIDGDDVINHFSIEKSYDGRNFLETGLVEAAKNPGLKTFQYTDQLPGQGFNYYRVRVNTPTDSNLVSPVSFQYVELQTNIKVYPNPANSVITLYFPEASSAFECLIVNDKGSQVIKAITLHGKHNTINVAHLPKGRYSLILKHQNKRLIIPFMKG